jgi:hypothetical protein
MTIHIKLWQQHFNVYNPKTPYTLAGFEPGIFCSVGGRDDHYGTPPGPDNFLMLARNAS